MSECPDDDAFPISRIEVDFAVDTIITQDQQRRLIDLVEEIIREPWNQPDGCVHWLASMGAKPRFSLADQRFLGVEGDPGAPESGEPTFDDEVLHLGSYCRERYDHPEADDE